MKDLSFLGGAGSAGSRSYFKPISGLVIGVVTDNNHPDGQYAVRVSFPALPSSDDSGSKGADANSDNSAWARVATFGASDSGSGMFILPEVGTEVVVGFLSGDFDHPVVLGTLWNGKDVPAYSNVDGSSKTKRYQSDHGDFKGKSEAKKNDVRGLSTRTGHELLFNDNGSEPRVTLSSGQKHRIVLNDKDNAPTSIQIYDGKNENFVLIDTASKKITIQTDSGDILLKAKDTITLQAKQIVTKSDQDTKMEAGANFEAKATSNLTLKASAQGKLEASGTLTIKGATVNIN